MPKKEQQSRAKGRKIGRSKKKLLGRGNAGALFARGVISAEEYFRQTGQKKG